MGVQPIRVILIAAAAGAAATVSAAGAAAAAAGAAPLPFCGETEVRGMDNAVRLRCDAPGDVISSIPFAAFGTPQGTCGNFAQGSCAANTTLVAQVSTAYCYREFQVLASCFIR